MNSDILTEYIDKIYKFAWSKSFQEDEAEELAQEILLAAVHALPGLRDESRFEPWLWSLAANTAKSFRRKMGKQRAMFVYDAPEMLMQEETLEEENQELYALLRGKIAMLTKIYRDIIILHYYDGLSTKQIAERLNIPSGTVTWRLSEARSKLKKECSDMEETALRPVNLRIGIYGSGNYDGKERPFPCEYIKDALSQNILYHCYESPKGIEELAKLCGVPAYYVEERIDNLLKRQGVIEAVKGKYQTDFIIWTDKYGKFCHERAETTILPMMEQLVSALEMLYRKAGAIGFYTAGKTEDELKVLLGTMAFFYLSKRYNSLEYPRIPHNYDGNGWRYIGYMETGAYRRTSIGHQICSNVDTRGTYRHEVYCVPGFKFRAMMYDYYVNVCEDILKNGQTEDVSAAAGAIQDGFIIRGENEELIVTVPAFTKEQKEQFDALVEEIFGPLMLQYSALVEQFVAGYIKLFPKHLEDDAKRMCREFFVGFYDTILTYCIRNGMITRPEEGAVCDVLLQWK